MEICKKIYFFANIGYAHNVMMQKSLQLHGHLVAKAAEVAALIYTVYVVKRLSQHC